MQEVAVIGLDLASNVFQVQGVAAGGGVVVRRQLRRGHVLKFFKGLSPCLFGIKACASAHHWALKISAFGQEVRLMPPAYVKRSTTDAADA